MAGSKELSTRKKDFASTKMFFDLWWKTNLGVVTSRVAEDVLINEVLKSYFDARREIVADPDRIKNAIKGLSTYWSEKPVSTVNRWSCVEYEKYRIRTYGKAYPKKTPLSVNTIRRELGVLRSALNMAHEDSVLDRKVFVFLPPEKHVEIDYFRCNEALGLIRAANKVTKAQVHIRLFLQIGFLTGRRKGAIFALKREHIDFNANIINWNSDVEKKTNKRNPIGRLPSRLKKILIRHFRKFPTEDYVISYQGENIEDIKKAFNAAVKAYRMRQAKVHGDKEDILPKAYPHMMRHSCVTWLMQRGKNPKDVCEFLGMSDEILRRRYYHYHPDFLKEVADEF